MKNRLFIDANVMLDLLGKRKPYYDSIAKIATLADKGNLSIIVSALSYPTIFYLLSKFESADEVRNKLQKFKIISEISDLDEIIIEKGLSSGFTDFEDALQYYCALKSECDILITRNVKDFKESEIPVMTADEYLVSIQNA
jgi:predicted nucleic acid-binding protein